MPCTQPEDILQFDETTEEYSIYDGIIVKKNDSSDQDTSPSDETTSSKNIEKRVSSYQFNVTIDDEKHKSTMDSLDEIDATSTISDSSDSKKNRNTNNRRKTFHYL